MQVLGHDKCYILFKRNHKGVVGINKCITGQEYWVDTQKHKLWWNKNYRNVFDNNDVEFITQRWHRFYIPPRQTKLWLMDD